MKFYTHAQVAGKLAVRPPEYAAELAAITAKTDGTGIWVDPSLPGWAAMVAKYRPKRVRRPAEPPCTGKANQPGSFIKIIFAEIGYEAKPGCGCEAMCRKMNEWGWKGCFIHRKELIQWFEKKAIEAGITVDSSTVWKIWKAVVKDLFRRKSTRE